MSLKQKALRGVVWTAFQSWGNQTITFIVFSVLARLLGPETFGLVALSNIFFAFMQIFLDQGFSQAIIRHRNLEPEHMDTAFWSSLGMGVLLMGLSCALAGIVAELFHQPALTAIIRCLSVSFVLGGLDSVQSAVLSRDLAFKNLAIRSLLATIAGGLVGVGMALAGYGVWSLVGQNLANGVVAVVVLWYSTQWRPRLHFSIRHFKDLFSFGVNVMGVDVLNFLNRRSDDFLIGYFLGPVALGYYTVAYRILLIVSQLMVSTIQRTALPVFSQLQHDPDRLREVFYSAIQITSAVALPVFLGLSVLSPELITILFGDRWAPSAPVMRILLLIGVLYAGFYYNGPLIMAMGKPSWNLALNCLQAIGNIVFFLVAVRWGIVAVATSYVIRGYLMAPITVWVVNKVLPLKLKDYLSQYAGPLAASLVMVIALIGAKTILTGVVNIQITLAICVALGLLVYVATIMAIAPKLWQRMNDLFRAVLPKTMLKKT